VYDALSYQVKRGRRSGHHGRIYGKSQPTDFNEDTTNESASVACSNVYVFHARGGELVAKNPLIFE